MDNPKGKRKMPFCDFDDQVSYRQQFVCFNKTLQESPFFVETPYFPSNVCIYFHLFLSFFFFGCFFFPLALCRVHVPVSCTLYCTQPLQHSFLLFFLADLRTLPCSELSFSQPLLCIAGLLSGEWMESVPPSENLARHRALTHWITDRHRHPTSLLGI